MSIIDKMAEVMQKYRDSRGEPVATGNCLGLAQAAWDVVKAEMLGDGVTSEVRTAIYAAPSIDCAVEALTAAINKLEE